MLIVCLRVPHFALRVALIDHPERDSDKMILTNPQSGRTVVVDVTTEARNNGIKPGMTVREALTLCPEVITLLPNPAREASISTDILDQLKQMSPLVEADPDESGCWYIDLTGLGRHYDSPTHAARCFLQAIPSDLLPRAGVASGKFTARVAAGITPAGLIETIDPVNVQKFLTTASVTWLPLPADTIHQLQRLGLETLGQFADLPGHKVAARFGPAGRTAWELAQGIDKRPVIPAPYVEIVKETLVMPTPAVSREMLLVGLRQLISRMFSRPTLRGKQVREVRLSAIIERRESWERKLVLKEPCSAERLIRAVELRLQALELPGPIESITLELGGITREVFHQEVLPQLRTRQDSPLIAAIHQLKQRYGLSPIYRIVEVEPWSRIPERRHALISYEP